MLKRRSILTGLAVMLALGAVAAVLLVGLLTSISREHKARMDAVERHLKQHEAELASAVATVLSAHEGGRLDPARLPPPLRAPGVGGAFLGEDHVTLYVNHTPDTDHGFRIWTTEQAADFADAPTAVAGVYRFRYCDDHAEGPANRPD